MLVVESKGAVVVSIGAVVAGAGSVTTGESTSVDSVVVAESLQATKKADTANTKNNFFILLIF